MCAGGKIKYMWFQPKTTPAYGGYAFGSMSIELQALETTFGGFVNVGVITDDTNI